MPRFEDPYRVEEVLQYIHRPTFLYTSTTFKSFGLLGDRLASAFIVEIPEKKLLEPEVAYRIAVALKAAFGGRYDQSFPQSLPYLSIHLLTRLSVDIQNSRAGEAIATTLDYLRRRATAIRNGSGPPAP